MQGRFIIFEGGEGAGKSTAAKALHQALLDAGRDVILTREPGGTPRAEGIRKLILNRRPEDSFNPSAQLMLFYAARMQHVTELVLPALQKGQIVICDRFEVSTFLYQVHAGAVNADFFNILHSIIMRQFDEVLKSPWACEYVMFDIAPEIGLARVKQAKLDSGDVTPDAFDDADISFHQKVHAGLRKAVDVLNPACTEWYFVDASQSPELVLRDIRSLLKL